MTTFVIAALLAQAASADSSYQAAADLFRQGQVDAALAAFGEIVKANPTHARAWKAIGVVHVARGAFRAADIPLATACSLAPDLEDACYYYGRNLYVLNRFEESLTALERSLAGERRPARVHQAIALDLEAMGRGDDAEQRFRKAINANRRGASALRGEEDPRVSYASFLLKQGRAEDARKTVTPVAAESPAAAGPRLELARALFYLGRLDEAAAQLQDCVGIDPRNGPAHLLLGKVYGQLGRAADSEKHLRLGAELVQATARPTY